MPSRLWTDLDKRCEFDVSVPVGGLAPDRRWEFDGSVRRRLGIRQALCPLPHSLQLFRNNHFDPSVVGPLVSGVLLLEENKVDNSYNSVQKY